MLKRMCGHYCGVEFRIKNDMLPLRGEILILSLSLSLSLSPLSLSLSLSLSLYIYIYMYEVGRPWLVVSQIRQECRGSTETDD